jgi:hypothetical protein
MNQIQQSNTNNYNNNFDKNKIDNISLDGTNIDELRQLSHNMTSNKDINNNFINNNSNDFIQSITKEIINNLKDNNISFDNDTISIKSSKSQKSQKSHKSHKSPKMSGGNKSEKSDEFDYLDDTDNSLDNSLENFLEEEKYDKHAKPDKHDKIKKIKDKNKIKNLLKENFEEILDNDSILKKSKNYLDIIFDDCFSLKDFFLLFSIYFILSQDMIKDIFAQYFTCINPDDFGKVGAKGVIIYGLILTVLFMIIRKFI